MKFKILDEGYMTEDVDQEIRDMTSELGYDYETCQALWEEEHGYSQVVSFEEFKKQMKDILLND